MKKINKLLMLISSSTLLIPLTLLVSCKAVNKKTSTPLSDNEFISLVQSINSEDDLLKYADIKYKDPSGDQITKENVLPTRLSNDDISIIFKDLYDKQISANITNIKLETTNNPFEVINEAIIFIEFKNTSTSKAETKKIKFTGLNTKNTVDNSGHKVLDELAYFNGEAGYTNYTNLSQKERFKFDNDKYIKRLESEFGGSNIDIQKFRGLETNQDNINNFDKQAESSNFDTYYNAALKGFTLPVYKDGKISGLKINDASETIKGPSPIDSLGRNQKAKTNGLARTIPNKTYKTAAIQTFQVSFKGWKDYAQEIAEAEYYIKLFEKWTDEQIKSYIDRQLWQLEQNLKYDLNLVDKDIATTRSDLTGVIAEHNKKKARIQSEFEQEKKKISALNRNKLVQWQKEEIEKYKKKKEEKIFQTSESGTMWIMDYINENNNKTPTKFYFGTNSHVAKAIKDDLVSVSLTRINSDINVGQTFNINGFDKNFTTFTFEAEHNNKISDAITAIFHATDFINNDINPVNLLESSQKEKYKDAGIFADFAVIEIDFEKLLNNSEYTHTVWSESKEITSGYETDKDKLISNITNDYAGNNSKKVQFVSDSLLDEAYYKKYDRKLDFDKTKSDEVEAYKKLESLYIVGYPTANEDYYLDQYEDHTQLSTKKYDFSLWVNSESKYYKKLANKEGHTSSFSKDELEKGNFLSYQIGYRSFIDKPGLTDGFLAAHRVGKKLYTLNEKTNGQSKKYFNYGLEILPRFYAPAGGASGSSVRTKDNKLLAVYHASNNVAKTGLAAAFRSNGYDYKELFGKYNLGQYDLIYGGGKDQEKDKSYREVLLKKYPEKKSALFTSGFKEDNIPEEFKFKTQAK
ncbi:Ig-specific serine endopeptidase MIP [Mycoplasma mycoides]|uniref:Ig-specific serine endopeptidase MIP n=1 Tax=Mycoplasma mycoides TaxID=2102 RepID=UPI0022400F0F|nr:DUF31 family protein [Mycoplasma mycoides]QVK03357.1 DUF31 family protein [Mycoplasma mycoides subsp. capri]